MSKRPTKSADSSAKSAAKAPAELTKPKLVERKPRDSVGDVAAFFESKGFVALRNKGSLVDIMAQKSANRSTKTYFVKVITEENKTSADVEGAAKGVYIQNAVSNNATPVFASITYREKRDGSFESKIECTDVNTDTIIRVIGASEKSKEKPKESA